MQHNRPLSPHLTIYKPQITSLLSIMHRMTGAALFVGTLVFLWGIILGIYSKCNCVFSLLNTPAGQILVACWSFALFYHLSNGIRHLFWDAGKGFSLAAVTRSGIAVLISATVLTAITWLSVLN